MASHTFDDRHRNQQFNLGYMDGYRKREQPEGVSETYKTGFEVGAADRWEDEEAIKSGTFDLLNEEERKEIYGDEQDRV